MRQLTRIILIASLILACSTISFAYGFNQNGVQYVAKTAGKDFMVYSNQKWSNMFIKGVNMGAAKPGYFPGELAITKEEYLRWFKQIAHMNSNTIRVYTTQKPVFYDALLEYNKSAKKPIYLIQGVWISEEDISRIKDAFGDNGKILNDALKDTKNLIDIFHGKADLPFQYGVAHGKYRSDVSKYVIGWIFGIEWDPDFVENTNAKNPHKTNYAGKYLKTYSASPFESFLCQWGDKAIEYEQDKYGVQRPVSFTNWITTDMLKHPNEPYDSEDKVEVNTEHIKAQDTFIPGLFASYHIYPYYPEFMNYQKEYREFKDQAGKIDSYRAYLRDLIKEHTMPVLVAEFGIPASRGLTHINTTMGYNQGFHDEKEQGDMLVHMMKGIYSEGYCGGLVFSWQDEWFKRTWNTMDLDLPDERPYWSNPQTCEQEFGIMAFDPGKKTSICYVDGDIREWSNDSPIMKDSDKSIYVKSDEKYLYMMIKPKKFNFKTDSLIIPIDTIQNQGNNSIGGTGLSFKRAADFVITINGEDQSSIKVDSYYDAFNYTYSKVLEMIESTPKIISKNSGIFNPINLCLNRSIYLPEDQKTIPFLSYETGKLKQGNGNPRSKLFNSLTDFSHKSGNIEIRIPWQLLNVMDPSKRKIMDDFNTTGSIKAMDMKNIYIGAKVVKKGETSPGTIKMNPYSWKTWILPTYHERLKPSYFSLKSAFSKLN